MTPSPQERQRPDPAESLTARRRAAARRAIRARVERSRRSGQVLVCDTTLRDGEQMPGVAFSPEQKARIALALERAGIHTIEAGFAASGRGEMEGIRAVAHAVSSAVVMSLARIRRPDIDAADDALAGLAPHRRGVALFVATSPFQRGQGTDRDRGRLLARIEESVSYARRAFDIVAFAAEDASRTETGFLCDCLRVAIEAGATSVAVPDTVGLLLPGMAAELVRKVQDGVPNLDQALLAVHFHDDLGLAAANTLAAVQSGVQVIQCTVGGLGERAGNAALEEVAVALRLHGETIGRELGLRTTELTRLCRLVGEYSGVPAVPNKAVTGANIFATEAGIHQEGLLRDVRNYQPYPPELVGADPGFRLALGKHSGRQGLRHRLAALGLELPPAALEELLSRIKELPRPADADADETLAEMARQLVREGVRG